MPTDTPSLTTTPRPNHDFVKALALAHVAKIAAELKAKKSAPLGFEEKWGMIDGFIEGWFAAKEATS